MTPLTRDVAFHQIESWLAGTGKRWPVMIAVDGHSAAGKSTFAGRLADNLDAAVVDGDDFYRLMEPGERSQLAPAEGAELYYDWERMREQALGPLQEGRVASYRPYDWEDNTLASRTITIEPRPIVIVEGLFVSRPELDSINDLTVLVVTDPQVRNRRQSDRADASQEWLKRWNAAERWYFNHVRPPECFDLIVSGTRQT